MPAEEKPKSHPLLLEHDTLVKLTNHFLNESTKTNEGVCYGFSSTYLLARLANDLTTFTKRLNLILSYQEKNKLNELHEKINKLKEEIKNKKAPYIANKEELDLLEVQAFFETIALQQRPDFFSKIYNRPAYQNFHKNSQLFLPKKLDVNQERKDKSKPQLQHASACALTIFELEIYFIELAKILDKSEENHFHALLNSGEHAMAISYDKRNQQWELMDINYLNQDKYIQKFDAKGLAQAIFKSFRDDPNNDYSVFAIGFVSLQKNTKLSERLTAFNRQYLGQKYSKRANSRGETQLSLAVNYNHTKVVKRLIDAGADVNKTNKFGASQLFIAVYEGNFKMVEALLSKGANISENWKEWPFLKNPKTIEHEKIVALFNKAMLLYQACSEGNTATFNDLLEQGVGFNFSYKGKPLLYVAAEKGNTDIVNVLIKNGKDANKQCGNDLPILAAIRKGHVNVVQALINRGADVNQASEFGDTPLFTAAFLGNFKIVELLLNKGADISQTWNTCPQLVSPETTEHEKIVALFNKAMQLYQACSEGDTATLNDLLEQGVSFNFAYKGKSPLFVAAEKGHIDIVKTLISNGTDINKQSNGDTPLLVAIRKGHFDVVQALINNGANVNQANEFGDTPLFTAAYQGDPEIFKLLLNKGADINKNCHGCNPFYIAAQNGHVKIINLLLKHRAIDVNSLNNIGATPLLAATQNYHIAVVEALLNAGAEVDKDFDGYTPLHIATHNGQTNIVKALINKGADVNLFCKDKFLIDVAREGKGLNYRIIESLLVEAGADIHRCSDDKVALLRAAAHEGLVKATSQFLFFLKENPAEFLKLAFEALNIESQLNKDLNRLQKKNLISNKFLNQIKSDAQSLIIKNPNLLQQFCKLSKGNPVVSRKLIEHTSPCFFGQTFKQFFNISVIHSPDRPGKIADIKRGSQHRHQPTMG